MCADGTHVKDPPRTYNCHIGVHFDISEFCHARRNIVHNVQIFIKRIQVDGPIICSKKKDS